MFDRVRWRERYYLWNTVMSHVSPLPLFKLACAFLQSSIGFASHSGFAFAGVNMALAQYESQLRVELCQLHVVCISANDELTDSGVKRAHPF